MPTSEKQIEANRRNAQKSTGPRTPEGKAAVSRNAVKNGLKSSDIVLKSPHLNEDPKEYKQLVDSLFDELKPKGVIQEHLVLKIANSLWRYQRVINAETARINDQLETSAYDIERGRHLMLKSDTDDLDEDRAEQLESNHAGARSVPTESYRKSLMYYEMRLDRQLTRSFRLLHQLQKFKKQAPDIDNARSGRTPFMGDFITPNKPISNETPDPPKALSNIDNAPGA